MSGQYFDIQPISLPAKPKVEKNKTKSSYYKTQAGKWKTKANKYLEKANSSLSMSKRDEYYANYLDCEEKYKRAAFLWAKSLGRENVKRIKDGKSKD